MKKLFCLTILIFMVFVSYAQNRYYWSGGHKICLDTDSSQMVVRFDNEQNLQSFVATTPQASQFKGKAMVLVDIRANNVKQKISTEKSVRGKTFAYKFSCSNAP